MPAAGTPEAVCASGEAPPSWTFLFHVLVGAWSAFSLSAVARAAAPEFLSGMDDEVMVRRVREAKVVGIFPGSFTEHLIEDLGLVPVVWMASWPADAAVRLLVMCHD
eukprot:s1753_g4.t1